MNARAIPALHTCIVYALISALGVGARPPRNDSCAASPDHQDGFEGEHCLLQSKKSEALRKAYVSEDDIEQTHQPKSSDEIPFSNRVGKAACKCKHNNCTGRTCSYSCNDGYVAVGKHVYRKYASRGQIFIKKGFFGGRCEKLCTSSSRCSSQEVPIRWSQGGCLDSTCYKSVQRPSVGSGSAEDEALLDLARGNWALWQRARSPISGLYVDNLNSNLKPPRRGKADVTGCGLIMECIAVSLGFQSKREAQERVLQTLKALSGELPLVSKMARSEVGKFFPGNMDLKTGADPKKNGSGNTVATGLMFGGVLFAKTYFQRNFPDDDATKEIAKHATQLFESTEWDLMICGKDNKVHPRSGDRIAWDVLRDGKCKGATRLLGGKLQFNEAYVGRWLAFEWSCRMKKAESCQNLKKIWRAQQVSKKKNIKWQNPNSDMDGTRILSKWGSYVVQLPYYMAHPFNSDEDFQMLFENSWKVEKDFYAHAPYYAPDRYGVGAGPTRKDCAGVGYIADRLNKPGGCLTYSPSGTVGYLATRDPQVKKDVLTMLAAGEAVSMIPDPKTLKEYPVLDRRMMLDPAWHPYAFTMIDMAGELFGLGAYFLGNKFFIDHTNFFDDPKAPWV